MRADIFKRKLIKMIEGSNEFITWTNKDEYFENFMDDEILVCGEDDKETFLIQIYKV